MLTIKITNRETGEEEVIEGDKVHQVRIGGYALLVEYNDTTAERYPLDKYSFTITNDSNN